MGMQIDRRIFIDFNWSFLLAVFVCTALGIVNIFSTGISTAGVEQTPLYLKQLQWVGIGFLAMLIVMSIDYHTVTRHAYWIYFFWIVLLVLVGIFGTHARGSQRWIGIGGFSLQPSEFMKLTLVLALAKYFNDNEEREDYGFKKLLWPALLTGLPFLLILMQPDLGTALLIGIVFISMAFIVGVKKRSILIVSLLSAFATPLLWFRLKDYQRARITTFLDPSSDPFGSGYHIIQSVIAVGSGRIFGKGFLQGSQTRLKFLPEQQTDFIFSVFAEEWGFVGVVVLLFLLLHIILSGIKIAKSSRDYLGMVLAFGLTSIIFWEVFINIGMVTDLMPVVGIPLPFMSYGGSSLVMMFICSGLLMNISMHKFLLQR